MRDYVIFLLFLLLPFAFISPGILHGGQQFFLMISALIIIGMLCENKWIRVFLVYIALWQLYLFVHGLIAIDLFAKRIDPQIKFGLIQTMFAVCGAVIYKGVIDSKIKLKHVYNIICVTAIIQSLLALSQMCGYDPVLAMLNLIVYTHAALPKTTVVGTLGNPNFLAAYLAISLPFFFRKYWCWFIPVIIFLFLFAKTSTAVFAVTVGCIIYFKNYSFKVGKIKITGLIIGILFLVIGVGYFINEAKVFTDPRYGFWLKAINNLKTIPNWIFGLGPAASWGYNYPLHNEWLTILYQYGLIGLGLAGGFVYTVYRGNKILFTALIIALVSMFGSYPLHLAPSAFLIIIIAGLMGREKESANA